VSDDTEEIICYFSKYVKYRILTSKNEQIRLMTSEDCDTLPYWFTIAEACEYLRVSKSTIYDYMNDERLPFFTLAGSKTRRLKRQDLDALLEPGQINDLNASDSDSE